MVQKRHPDVAQLIIGEMHQDTRSESIRGVVECEGILQSVGFQVPKWAALAQGAHPFNPEGDEDSTAPRTGWQRPATSRLHEQCASEMWPAFSNTEKALMLSQSGPMSGEPFSCFPTTRETRFDFQSFRLLLLRRLRLPLPITARRCRCGRPLDSSGHHRAACARVGVLGRRGFALESAAARVCREAGGRVMTNILVRDMDHVCTERGHVSGACRRGQSCQACRPRGGSGRTLVCRGGTNHPRACSVKSNFGARVHASVRGACMVPQVAKDVGVHCGESFRQFFVGTPLSCLGRRGGPVGARRDSGWPSREMRVHRALARVFS